MITEFQLTNPEDNLNWEVKMDFEKKNLILTSQDNKYRWARKIKKSLPIDAFLLKKNVFITWERQENGYDRLQEFSSIIAHDLFTGKILWNWKDNIITILPFFEFVFIMTYRNKNKKGFLIKTDARNGKVVWKIATDSPLISWDIDNERMILKDYSGRIFALNTKTGKQHKMKNKWD